MGTSVLSIACRLHGSSAFQLTRKCLSASTNPADSSLFNFCRSFPFIQRKHYSHFSFNKRRQLFCDDRTTKGSVNLFRQFAQTLYSVVMPHEVNQERQVPKSIKKPAYARTGVVPGPGSKVLRKTMQQIEGMRSACALARNILDSAGDAAKVGVTTEEIDELVHSLCVQNNAYPSPLLYKGFPKSVCTSVNNVVCHGIPDNRPLMDGDIVNIDVTVYLNGYHGDCSETYLVGNVDECGRLIVDAARHCRDAGIAVCKPGVRFCDIGSTISAIAKSYDFSIIPEFCGHGIGENFHELPDIFHFEYFDEAVMESGMVFTVEPIICDGKPTICILEDGWTALTCDSSRTAQFEHTILVTDNGVDILTS